MTTLTNNLNKQLFTDLTPEQASVVEGGAKLFETSIDFDFYLTSRTFKNNRGSKIETLLETQSTGSNFLNRNNKEYNVLLQRLTKGNFKTIAKSTAPIDGNKSITWTNLNRGDKLRLAFTDAEDGKRIDGSLTVWD